MEGVQPLQGFTSSENMAALLPSFKMPEESGKSNDEEKNSGSSTSRTKEKKANEDDIPEIVQLAMNVSFKEMIKFFLTPNQAEILNIRNKLRGKNDLKLITIFMPSGSKPKNFDEIRNQLYMIHFQIFRTTKGFHCHVIV